MPDNDTIKESGALALKSLKKIIASNGKLQGNFYFAGDTKGEAAGLVVTLTARDPKGSKAANQGKQLRKSIKGAKFGRGIVTGPKLTFELHSGSASASVLKKSFKTAFEDDELKPLKALLRKAKIGKPGQTEEPEETEDTEETQETEEEVQDQEITDLRADMTEEELQELSDLVELQGSLSEANEALKKSFLSLDEAEEELNEQLDELENEILALQSADPVDEEALQAKRLELAEVLYTGPELTESDEVDPNIRWLLEASEKTLEDLTPPPISMDDAIKLYQQAILTVQKQLSTLATEMKKEDDQELEEIATGRLDELTEIYHQDLDTALTGDPNTPDVREQIVRTAGRFEAHISSSEQVLAVDSNPFNVSVTMVTTLGTALRSLVRSARV